jgi:hypothetical protein
MSLLDNPTEKFEDTGTTTKEDKFRTLRAALLAVALVVVAIVIYIYFGQRPPVASGELVKVVVHPVHTITRLKDAAGFEGPEVEFDQQLVLGQIKVTNQSKNPVVISALEARAIFDDGPHSSEAASRGDFDRLFVAYPSIANLKGTPLWVEQAIEPGQTAEGWVAAQFHVTQEQWAKRKDTKFVVSLRYQKSVELPAPHSIPEQ